MIARAWAWLKAHPRLAAVARVVVIAGISFYVGTQFKLEPETTLKQDTTTAVATAKVEDTKTAAAPVDTDTKRKTTKFATGGKPSPDGKAQEPCQVAEVVEEEVHEHRGPVVQETHAEEQQVARQEAHLDFHQAPPALPRLGLSLGFDDVLRARKFQGGVRYRFSDRIIGELDVTPAKDWSVAARVTVFAF